MYSFVVKLKPRSYNSWVGASVSTKSKYKLQIEDAFRRRHQSHLPIKMDLYGLVYHFFRADTGIDADNLSKPIWDCLKDILYEDDKQVKLRIAGGCDLANNDITILDFSGLSSEVATELIDAFVTEEHVLYVECSYFSTALIQFNLLENGN